METMANRHDKPWLADLVRETLERNEFDTHREMLAYNQGRVEVMLKLADRDKTIDDLKQDIAFWRHLFKRTSSLADLRAAFAENMLKQAVDLLVGAVFRNDTEGVEEFCNTYFQIWGKDEDR